MIWGELEMLNSGELMSLKHGVELGHQELFSFFWLFLRRNEDEEDDRERVTALKLLV